MVNSTRSRLSTGRSTNNIINLGVQGGQSQDLVFVSADDAKELCQSWRNIYELMPEPWKHKHDDERFFKIGRAHV